MSGEENAKGPIGDAIKEKIANIIKNPQPSINTLMFFLSLLGIKLPVPVTPTFGTADMADVKAACEGCSREQIEEAIAAGVELANAS